ncbi:ABC transporter permease [Actinomadura barringtoniae]|uniref:ABC transporter permease n=1 Tax=Actinomadura barringtoniae TaxID=1427535 RepID=A0A939PPL1_9ACTN|nr:ABC transporter permease [Actinomadura barringtoniae]MBO2452371.1 ABC transporter permease [Actinomadura barringtoniae]
MRLANVMWVVRLDLSLLWRNRTALFTVIGLPLLFASVLYSVKGQKSAGIDSALYVGTGYLAYFLVFSVFMNLVTVFTARREDLTLKRLRSGPLTEAELLGGSAVMSGALYLIQAVLLLVVMGATLGGRFPADLPMLLVGLVLGIPVFALLAFAVSGLTPNADMAQLTVLPLIFACMIGSGVMFPLDSAPEAVQQAARFLPLSPLVEITRDAYFGDGSLASYAKALGIFVLWAALGLWAARRWFRWEPRHA